MNRGVLLATAAYVLWGIFPIYFHALAAIAPIQVLLYRIVWGLLFVAIVLAIRRQWSWLAPALADVRVWGRFLSSALVLSSNWFVYIWACDSERVVDASLGYFINPLVNVVLAALVLHERLRPGQCLAVAVAASGVVWLAWQSGAPPWTGLYLAVSFAVYGLLRKTGSLGALEGLALETLLLFPVALAALAFLTWRDQNALVNGDAWTRWMLVAAGPVTAVPLLCFGAAARRIPFALLGILQYISPSLQLLIGLVLFHEAFGVARAAGFVVIWLALVLYAIEGQWFSRRREADVASAARLPTASAE